MNSTIITPARDRIVLADALRGFALMGLFIVHMVEYFELYWYQPEPGWIHDLVFFLFGGKAYGIFALLFGLSFYIILDNYQKRGVNFRFRFCWRLVLLLVIGYLHSLIYAGDILQVLALCGFLLALCYSLPTKYFVYISIFFLLQIPQIFLIVYHEYLSSGDYDSPIFQIFMNQNFEMFAHASFTDLVEYNVYDGQFGKWAFFIETGRLWNIVGLMFCGAALGRTGFFEKRKHSAGNMTASILAFIALGLTFYTLSKSLPNMLNERMAVWCTEQLFSYYCNLTIIAVSVCLFIVLFENATTNRIVISFSPCGRMTLTLYLIQSIVFVPVFYGFGLSAYDYIGQQWSLILGILCWLVQMKLSAWWLRHYRYGPVEWAWRKLTFVGYKP